MKTKAVLLSLFVALVSGCASNSPKPLYEEEYPKIVDFIAANWHTSCIDSAYAAGAGFIPLVPPKPFMSISAYNPVLFYWDNYFTNKGLLLIDSLSIYAVNVTDDLLWMVDQIGFVPNANMTWGMNRSQVPYLALMVEDVFAKTGDKEWLAQAYGTLKKEYHFWTDTSENAIEDHRTSIAGLQRFYHHASTDELLTLYEGVHHRGLEPIHPDSLSEAEKCRIAGNYAAEAQTMDFTPRFEQRCPDFIAVDLNSNLYRYERFFAHVVELLGLAGEPDWAAMAEQRKALINQYCWNDERGLYMDYDFVNNRSSKVASVACMYPLMAGIASEEQAKRTVQQLHLFEYEYGVTVCEQNDSGKLFMWDYPVGWPPVYLYTIQALHNYGYTDNARRICIKYLDVAAKNFIEPFPASYAAKDKTVEREPGYLYEKYNVITGGIDDTEYAGNRFLGWSAGVFIWCLDYLGKGE